MPRTRLFTEFSAEGILAVMEPSREYRTGLIAQSLGVGNVKVREVLDGLVRDGRLSKRYDESGKEYRFHLTSGQTPTVAERRSMGDLLTRVLNGYEDEMRRHVSLCMTLRRVA
jgi:predicted ArsR family transcriptional regulator